MHLRMLYYCRIKIGTGKVLQGASLLVSDLKLHKNILMYLNFYTANAIAEFRTRDVTKKYHVRLIAELTCCFEHEWKMLSTVIFLV